LDEFGHVVAVAASKTPLVPDQNLADVDDAAAARTNLGLVIGTDVAAESHTHDAADIISGTFADARISESSVTQHADAIDLLDLGNVTGTIYGTGSGIYYDGTNWVAGSLTAGQIPTLTLSKISDAGTAAASDTGDFATAAQGTLADSALQDVVDDTTPQLGGNLDVNGQSIVSTSAGNILITPDTTGKIVLDGLSWPTADGTADQVLKTDGLGQLSFATPSGGGGSSTDFTNDPSATTVRQFNDLLFNGVTASTGTFQTEVGTFGSSGWTWRSDYNSAQYDYQDDDAIGVMWASEAGAFDRGLFYGSPSILRASPSDGDKCLFECRLKFSWDASSTNSYIAVGFASTQNNNNHQDTFLTPSYGGTSRAGIYFRAGQTYLRSFVYDNWNTAGNATQADITSVTQANDTWYRLGAVCTYDAANTRWVVDSYCNGTLVATQYLTTWGPPPSYGVNCYNNGDAYENLYAFDWVSAEYVRYQNPSNLHIEDV